MNAGDKFMLIELMSNRVGMYKKHILFISNVLIYYACFFLKYGNLLSFLLRCGTRPYERGTQWDSNSLV